MFKDELPKYENMYPYTLDNHCIAYIDLEDLYSDFGDLVCI